MSAPWPTLQFDEAVEDASGGNIKTKQNDYAEVGEFPIVDQGKALIAGYTDDEAALCKVPLPVVIFGDHTRCLKFVDFPFGMGADGVKVLKPKAGLDAKFLYHYLRQIKLPDGGYDRHFKYLKRETVPLPPLEEQRRIAAILDQAETLRTQRRTALALLDSLTQSLFLDMFGDPVANAKGWPTPKFGEVGALDRGISKHRPRNAPELLGGKHPLVQTGEVANCDGYIRSYTSTYSDLGLRQSKMWPAGTLCITIAANIAKTGILTFDACFPDSVVGFRADDPATVEYVRVWLSFLQKALEDSAPESAQKNINLAILRGLSIPLPPLPLQQTFATRIAAIEALKATHRRALAALDALFASLQQRAFAGQL